MIILSIKPYCESCGDFEADVEKSKELYFDDGEPMLRNGETVIRCKNRELCDRIRRHYNDKEE